MGDNASRARVRGRVIGFLARGAAIAAPAADRRKILLDAGARGTISAPASIVEELARDGLLSRSGKEICLTALGQALAKERTERTESHAAPSREIAVRTIDTEDGPVPVLTNLAESPLGQLMRRKTRDGVPFLTGAEFAAGERLRADYTRGQIMPRMGANWEAAVASGRRSGGAGGMADLTDAALEARRRVDRAIEAVGPELSGVLIDVCCFLKGLELVEAERGWPARSAKIVLKSALGVLSRHYNPQSRKTRADSGRVMHWGAADYRPTIS